MLDPLNATLFAESRPIPLKAPLAQLGLWPDDVRLPVARGTPARQQTLLAVLAPVMRADAYAAHRPARALAG